MSAPLLTEAEHRVVDLSSELAVELHGVIGHGPSRAQDLRETFAAIHMIQNAVLAQAAARAYPERYRLMGEALVKDIERGED